MNRFFIAVLSTALLLFSFHRVYAQEYIVNDSKMAYKHTKNDSIEITKKDALSNNDIISIHDSFDRSGQLTIRGYITISNKVLGETKTVKGEHSKQRVQDLISSMSILDKCIQYLQGIFTPKEKRKLSAGHYAGPNNYFDCSFVCNNMYYKTIKDIPHNLPFGVQIVNKTDSVLYFSMAIKWESLDSTETQFLPNINKEKPLILVPGESKIVKSPFIIRDNYVCHIDIFGSRDFFVLEKNPEENTEYEYLGINTEGTCEIKKYYYGTSE